MRVHRRADGKFAVDLTGPERSLLENLSKELVALLDELGVEPAGSPRDPALSRLLPDAYADESASAEFRRFTEDELAGSKTADARAVTAALGDGHELVLDRLTVGPWLRSLTDLRLVLATRLGIHEDGDEGDPRPEADPVKQVYLWLGYLQESLLNAVSGASRYSPM